MHWIVAAGSALLINSASALADTITLRASVRLPAEREVVQLGDIARLDGEAAEAFASLAIRPVEDLESGVLTIDIDEVQDALTEAGVHWGHVNLNGRQVIVRAAAAIHWDAGTARAEGDRHDLGASGTILAMQGMAVADGLGRGDRASDDAEGAALKARLASELGMEANARGAIARHFAAAYDVGADALRLEIEPGAHAEFLDLPHGLYRFEIELHGSLASERLPITVRAWTGEVIGRQAKLTVRPLLHAEASELVRDIRRGELFGEADLRQRHVWLPPVRAAAVATPDEALGKVAARSRNAGDLLEDRDLERETLIERGDIVTARCLVGGVVLSLQVEARDDGAEGDRIQFRKLGERDTFFATVVSRTEAVIDLSARE